MTHVTKEEALNYHIGGKIEIRVKTPCETSRDLSMAYTPGVAEPCKEIEADNELAYKYTNKANLVAVITDGTAVLGLGDIGAIAGKPVMEGKAVLFKKFANVDAFDIELDEHDPDKIVEICKALAPTFGGINLEDIRAPKCFEIERKLQEAVDIPVMHDDQHGTAMITSAGIINAMEISGKDISKIKIVVSGETEDRTLADAMKGADMFLGLSKPGVVTQEMVASMNKEPIIFALANPVPEIFPEDVVAVRDDVMMGTGRSDYPNQVNNVLGFPFIFRGALDVRAKKITENMKMAAARALAQLAKEPVPAEVLKASGVSELKFGKEYIIPKPFDKRVLTAVAPAVAKAAVEDGVARVKDFDVEAYKAKLAKGF